MVKIHVASHKGCCCHYYVMYMYCSKQSKQTAANVHIKTNGSKEIAPKKKAIDSAADYFGSAPITRSGKPQSISLRKVIHCVFTVLQNIDIVTYNSCSV